MASGVTPPAPARGVEAPARGEAASTTIWSRARYPLGVRLVNRIGVGLRRLGRRWPRLETGAMLADARRRTRLTDFGDERFLEPFQRLVDEFDARDEATAFGRHFFREYCVGLLVNRLRIEEAIARAPEVLDVPLQRPLVITGLPRSGTTLLHRLMSEDPAGRTLLFWEQFEPAPPPRPETYTTDPRIARARKAIALMVKIAPRIPAAHLFGATEAEECNGLFANEFRAGIIGFMFDVPEFVRWLNAQDLIPGYRSMRRQLQLLSLHVRGDYWVLKAPAHLYGLDALLAVYPDACIVQTHRDPLQVIPSVCSLAAGFRSIVADPIDLSALGANFVEAMAVGPDRAIAARASADPARFFDVGYDRLTADPIGTVRAVCRHFGYDFTPEYEARTRRYLAENPQHKHGVHRYSLGDFGLDAETVNRRFAAYRAWAADHLGAGP